MATVLIRAEEKKHEVRTHRLVLDITVNDHEDDASRPNAWDWRELLDLDPHENVKIVEHHVADHPFMVDDEGEPV